MTRSGAVVAIPRAANSSTLLAGHLRRAAETVRREWEPQLHESAEPGEVARLVEMLTEGIASGDATADLPLLEGNPSLTRFLLERIGSALLESLSADADVDRDGVLRALRGVDEMRRRVEPAWDRYFASQISGPDGLNMVTEVLHDLRSPLTAIRCLAELIERGRSGTVTEVQQKQLRLIYGAAVGIGSLVSDVIEMARHGEQVAEGERVPFSVSQVFEEVAVMVRPIAAEKELRMSFQQLPSDQRVGLPHALSRVLLNLVTNALKFTDQGSVEVRVKATSLSRVEFSVADTGHGIPDEAIPHLYRPFRRSMGRVGRSSHMFSGTGLGLALCRKLLRTMDSELKFETTVSVGTRFYFELDLPHAGHL